MAQIYGARPKYLRYGISMFQMTEISLICLAYVGNGLSILEMTYRCLKLLKYLTNGLNMWELTQRFWEIAKIFLKFPRYMGHGLRI